MDSFSFRNSSGSFGDVRSLAHRDQRATQAGYLRFRTVTGLPGLAGLPKKTALMGEGRKVAMQSSDAR
jgi:hypothetical protein